MKRLKLLFFLLMWLPVQALSQSLSVQSHYPSSAFVANRLLPFTVVGEGLERVLRVQIVNGQKECRSMVDPSYRTTFHIYCFSPSLVSAEVTVVDDSGEETDVSINYFNIFEVGEPGVVPTSDIVEPGGGQ